jgi:hypothetical protein
MYSNGESAMLFASVSETAIGRVTRGSRNAACDALVRLEQYRQTVARAGRSEVN